MAAIPRRTSRPKTILVICDHELIGDQRRDIFLRNGYSAEKVNNIAAARRRFREARYDLVLIDIRSLPEMAKVTGFCKFLKQKFPRQLFAHMSNGREFSWSAEDSCALVAADPETLLDEVSDLLCPPWRRDSSENRPLVPGA